MACHWLRRSWNVSRIQVLPVAPLFRSRLLASNQPSRYGKVKKHLILQFFVIWYLDLVNFDKYYQHKDIENQYCSPAPLRTACFKPAQQSLIWKVMWYVNLQNITLFYKIWHILSNHPKSLLHCCSAPCYLLQSSSAEILKSVMISHLAKYFVMWYFILQNICDKISYILKYFVKLYLILLNMIYHIWFLILQKSIDLLSTAGRDVWYAKYNVKNKSWIYFLYSSDKTEVTSSWSREWAHPPFLHFCQCDILPIPIFCFNVRTLPYFSEPAQQTRPCFQFQQIPIIIVSSAI